MWDKECHIQSHIYIIYIIYIYSCIEEVYHRSVTLECKPSITNAKQD